MSSVRISGVVLAGVVFVGASACTASTSSKGTPSGSTTAKAPPTANGAVSSTTSMAASTSTPKAVTTTTTANAVTTTTSTTTTTTAPTPGTPPYIATGQFDQTGSGDAVFPSNGLRLNAIATMSLAWNCVAPNTSSPITATIGNSNDPNASEVVSAGDIGSAQANYQIQPGNYQITIKVSYPCNWHVALYD
jgi:hypothetical protein